MFVKTMFSRFVAAQRAAHHNQLPIRRQCLSTSNESSSSLSSSSITSSLLAWYSKCLETHPLLTKGITSGLIAGTGDVICQWMVPSFSQQTEDVEGEPWDVLRTTRFIILGAVWVAPITHFWYDALSTMFLPGVRTRTKVIQRLTLDQFGFAPLFCSSFLAGLWVLEGRTEIWEPLQSIAPGVIQANWALWIPAQIVNFAVVPLKYQVLFGNVVALLWTVYLSWVNVSTRQEEES